MMQLSLTFAELKDSGNSTNKSKMGISHLALRTNTSSKNTRIMFDPEDFETIEKTCGKSGLLVNLLERQHAAIIAKGGKRNLIPYRNSRSGCMSVADKAITDKFKSMFGPEDRNIPLTLDTVKLGDGTLAVYVLFDGGAK